jgi:alkylhydroperoxidase family enzyme
MNIPTNIRKLVEGLLGGEGRVPKDVRRAAFDGDTAALPDALRPWVGKTAEHAHRIVDRDLDALRAAGYDEDQIFEITLCAATGAGFERLQRGLAALESAQ